MLLFFVPQIRHTKSRSSRLQRKSRHLSPDDGSVDHDLSLASLQILATIATPLSSDFLKLLRSPVLLRSSVSVGRSRCPSLQSSWAQPRIPVRPVRHRCELDRISLSSCLIGMSTLCLSTMLRLVQRYAFDGLLFSQINYTEFSIFELYLSPSLAILQYHWPHSVAIPSSEHVINK